MEESYSMSEIENSHVLGKELGNIGLFSQNMGLIEA